MNKSKRHAQVLGATRTLLATLAQTVPATELLQAAIEALAALLQVKYGAIGMLDKKGDLVQFVYTGMSKKEAGQLAHPPKGSGLLGVVIRENTVLRLDRMADDPRSKGFPSGHPSMTSLLAVPISNSEQVYGRLYLCDKFDNSQFSDEDEELALNFASALTLILDNAQKIDELKRERSLLSHSAFHDPLTNLPNRVLLGDRVGQVMCHANRNQTLLAIMYCDLDGFKAINDTLGHHVGDHVLKAMGERFVNCVRGDDTVARVGGDEFVFVLSEIESAEHAATVAQKILDAIVQRLYVGNHELMLSGSIGIAIYPFDGDCLEHLIKNADAAMYKAKECGKNNFQFFSQKFLAECAAQAGLFEQSRDEEIVSGIAPAS